MIRVMGKNTREMSYILQCDCSGYTWEVSARAFLFAHVIQCIYCHSTNLHPSSRQELYVPPKSSIKDLAEKVLNGIRKIR